MKKKNILTLSCIFLIPIMLLLSGCRGAENKKTKTDFPLDEKGYPKNDVVLINGKSYPIEISKNSNREIEVAIKIDKDKDEVEVIVPQYLPINIWSVDEKNILNLTSYSKIDFKIEDKDMLEGISNSVQKFQFQVTEGETIFLKWSNINEIEKPFKDKNEDYLLKVVVSK